MFFFSYFSKSQTRLQDTEAMQRKELKLEARRREEVQHDDQQWENRDYHRIARMRRGDGTRSTPLTTSHLKTLALDNRSRSEGNIIVAQMFDLKSQREVGEAQKKQTFQLPKLRPDISPRSSLLVDRTELKKKNFSKPVNDISRKTLRPLYTTSNERRRVFQEHIEQEEGRFEEDESKREHLLRWLSEQK